MSEPTIFPKRAERSDLKGLIAMGFLAVPYLAWLFWMELWPDLEAGIVRVPMTAANASPVLLASDGSALGGGGDLTPRIAQDLLPDSAVVLIRIGEVGGFAALAAAALTVALLGLRILRRGLFDRRLPTLMRISLVLCFMCWTIAGSLGTAGTGEAVGALSAELGGAYSARGAGFPAAMFIVFLMLIGWFEVILKAGRRIAKDQDGVI